MVSPKTFWGFSEPQELMGFISESDIVEETRFALNFVAHTISEI